MNSRLRLCVVAANAMSLALLLFAAEALAPEPSVAQTNAISPGTQIDLTQENHHHKEPVVIADRFNTRDRRAVAWMETASDNLVHVNIKVWNPETGMWESRTMLVQKTLVEENGSASGDPYFALNPVTHEVVVVTVDMSPKVLPPDNNWKGIEYNLHGIRLWTGKDFFADWCTSDCIQPADWLDVNNQNHDGMLVCGADNGDKPSVTFSPSGKMYVAHLHGNNIHVQRWDNDARTWSGITVRMPSDKIQSPIVIATQSHPSAPEMLWVIAEDLKDNKIDLWYADTDSLKLEWIPTTDQIPPFTSKGAFAPPKMTGTLISFDQENVNSDILDSGIRADTMLMARYNGHNDTIGIVWHERKEENKSEVRFVSFDTRKRKFGCSIPVTNTRENLDCRTGNEILSGLSTPASEFHPAIEVDSLGHYLVTYYNTRPEQPTELTTELKVTRLTENGAALWKDGKTVPDSASNPRGYDPPIGEYQDISYSAVQDTWYASFIKAGSQVGNTNVTAMTFPRFFHLIEHGSGDPAGTCTALPAAVEIRAGESIPLCAPEGTSWEWHLSSAEQPHHFFSGQRIEWVSPTIDTTYWVQVDDGEYSEPVHVTVASCVPATISSPAEYTGPASSGAVGSPVDVTVTANGTSVTYAWHLALVTGNGAGAWSATDLGPVVSAGPSYTWTPGDADLNKTYGLYVVVQGGCDEPPLPPRLIKVVQVSSSACPNAPTSGGSNRAVQANGCPAYSVEINPGESVTLSPPEGAQASSFEWEWYRSDKSVSSANFAHEKSVAVSPTVDTAYWVYNQYTVGGVIKEERSFNLYVLIRSAEAPGIHLEPRFQAVPANAGAVIEVVDPAVTDGNYDGYKFEWFQGNNNTSTDIPPLAWSFPRLPLELKDDVSFWCRVTKPGPNQEGKPTNVATVAVICTDGLRGSIHASPGNYFSKADQPLVSANTRGKWLRYDWFERLPEETTPRLYYKHTSSINVTPAQPLTYYSAKVQDACGQTAMLPEIPVYLCVPTIDTQPADQVVPRGGSASLTVAASPAIAGQPLTMTWRSAETGQVVGSGPTLNVTPAPGTTQTFYAEVSADCSGIPRSVATRAVSVTGCALAATAYIDRNIALGQTATLSTSVSGTLVPSSELEYTWFYGPAPGTEYTSGVGLWAITPPLAQTTTTYWVRVNDGTCIADSNPVTLRVCVPTITSQPQGTLIRANQTANLSVGVLPLNNETFSYQWFVGASGDVSHPVSGVTSNPGFTTPALTATTSYWVRVTSSCGATTDSAAAVVTVCNNPAISSVTPTRYIRYGETTWHQVYATGNNLTYQWYTGSPGNTSAPIYHGTQSSISQSPSTTTTYWARVTSSGLCTTDSPAMVIDVCTDPPITTQPVSRAISSGQSATLTVGTTATSPIYQWYLGTGAAIQGATASSLTVTPTADTQYYAQVTRGACTSTSDTATVTVCTLAASLSGGTNIASGQSATLYAGVSNSQANYEWYAGTGTNSLLIASGSGPGLWQKTVNPTITTQYWVRVSDGVCTADSNPVTVRICVPTITSQPQGTVIRSGQTASLSVGVMPLNNETFQYQWYAGASGDVSHPVSGVTSNPSFTTPALTATTSYWVRVTSSCGATKDSAAAVATVCNNPVISSVTPTRYIRYGESTWHQVYATGNNLIYQWYTGSPGNTSALISGATLSSISKSPSTTTTYWARVTSYGLCTTDSPAMVIDVCTDPPITTQPASKTVNSGQSATLSVATSTTGTTYQWYLGTGATIQGATSSSLMVTPTADTQYYAQVTRGACTSTSDTATVTVCSLAVSLAGSTNIASGQSATLTATVSGSRASTNYEWYAGTGANSYVIASGSGLWQKTVNPLATTQYWVRASDGTCTVDSAPVTVSVCKPTITAQPQGKTVNSGQTATLSVTATGAPLSYQWYIGAAGNTAQPIPGATLASYTTPAMSATTSHWVRVTGCTTADSVAATVAVCAAPTITSGPTPSSQRFPGNTGWLTVNASGTGLTYQWFTGQSGDTTVPVVGSGCNTAQCSFTLSSSKYYWVRIIGTCGTLNSPAVLQPVSPNIYQQPQSASVPPNATPRLSVGATGTTLTYQWYRGSTGNTAAPMSGATAPTFTVPPVTAPVSYWCRVTSVGDPTAIAYSAEATLSFCTGPAVYGPSAQYVGYNQWYLGMAVLAEEDIGTFYCAWYTGIPGDVAQSVFQYNGGNIYVTATGTQTWWCRAWYEDNRCYTDSGGATIRKVQ